MALSASVRSFWGRLRGLARLPGTQREGPGHYSAPAAAAVDFDTAMQVSAWWAGVRLIAETVACLPLRMYIMNGEIKKPDDSHPLWLLFNRKPNRYQTRVEFFETILLNLVCTGNAYIAVERVGGRIVSLLPLMTSQMVTSLLPDGTVTHTYTSGESVRVYAAQSMWHIKLFGNGIIGLSPLEHARQSLGIAIAAENRIGSIYRNGAKPTGVLMVDRVLSKEQREAVKANMAELASGNDDNLFVLEAGMTYQSVSMSPQDVELLSSRRFQLEDIARFLGVPSVLINDTSGSTTWGSGIAQIIEGFYKLNLRPYLERIECSAEAHLLSDADARKYEIEFDFDSLLRMDQPTRYDGYQKAINSGQLTPNEARAQEGRVSLPGGDQLFVQGAMVPIQMAGQKPNTQAGSNDKPNGN